MEAHWRNHSTRSPVLSFPLRETCALSDWASSNNSIVGAWLWHYTKGTQKHSGDPIVRPSRVCVRRPWDRGISRPRGHFRMGTLRPVRYDHLRSARFRARPESAGVPSRLSRKSLHPPKRIVLSDSVHYKRVRPFRRERTGVNWCLTERVCFQRLEKCRTPFSKNANYQRVQARTDQLAATGLM